MYFSDILVGVSDGVGMINQEIDNMIVSGYVIV